MLSEPLEPVVRQAPLSESQYKPTYNLYPPLQQDLNRVKHISQNQSPLEISRQIIHPRQIEIFKLPEFNLRYLNHKHQVP